MRNDIFKPRRHYKPFEYPGVMTFIDAINKAYWVHSEVDFTADVQDFKANLQPFEQEAVKRALLGIAQIEVNVKTFWGNIYQKLPKPEFNGLGSTFAECEFRHSEAYSRLLEVLGYNDEFAKVVNVPAIAKRIKLLSESVTTKDTSQKEFIKSLIMFSILVENVSLFSQFATILSFTRFKGYMKNVANIIAWTSVDEQIHANAGIWIVQQVKQEQPNLLDDQEILEIIEMVKESMRVESQILDWIFEQGELEYLKKAELLAYMKYRLNDSLTQMGLPKAFDDEECYLLHWFEEDVFANALDDFFAKRPVAYTKFDNVITSDSIFD